MNVLNKDEGKVCSSMEWIKIVFVSLLLVRAIYTDMKHEIIENKCVLAGLILALIHSYADSGLSGLLESVKMTCVTLGVLFFLFLIKGLGAGDVKLLCVLAACYPKNIIWIVAASFMIAAMISLAKMLIRWIKRVPVYVWGETLNFSIPIGCGTVCMLILDLYS